MLFWFHGFACENVHKRIFQIDRGNQRGIVFIELSIYPKDCKFAAVFIPIL